MKKWIIKIMEKLEFLFGEDGAVMVVAILSLMTIMLLHDMVLR